MAIQEQFILSKEPNGDIKLTQNSVIVFQSINTSALVNTLVLKEGNVGIGTDAPGGKLEILNSSTSNALYINQTGVATIGALYVYSDVAQTQPLTYIFADNASNTGHIVKVENDGTGCAINIQQDGVLATDKHGLRIYTSVDQVNSELVKMYTGLNTNTGTVCLIQQAGTGHGLYLHQDGVLASSKYGLYVYSNAILINSYLAFVDQDNAGSTAVAMKVKNDGTGASLTVEQNGVMAVSKAGLYVYTDVAQINSPLAYFTSRNAVATAPVLEIDNDGTGHGLYLHQDGILATTKHGLYLHNTGLRNVANSQLVYIHEDNASSDQSVLKVINEGTGVCINPQQDGNGTAVDVDNNGTGHGLYIHQDGILASGKFGLYVDSHLGNPQTQSLAYIRQQCTTSTGAVLQIVNPALGNGLIIDQAGVLNSSRYGLYVYSNAVQVNSALLYVHSDNASSTAPVLELANTGTGHGLYLHQDGVLASTKYGLYVYSNAVQTTSYLLTVRQDNASSTGSIALFDNDGTGHCLFITQDGVLASSKYGLYVYSDAIQVNTNLVNFYQDNASSTSTVMAIVNDGTGGCLNIDNNNTGYCLRLDSGNNGTHFRFAGDPTPGSPADGDFWFDGTNLKMRIGTTTYNVNLTAV